jgi:nanoRNase/pAp phosphatase (c-di-AMP/oligoRNAs hydrolase)
MTKNSQIPRAVHVIDSQSSIVIALPENPGVDAVLSATALYLALLKMNKTVSLSSSGNIPQEVSSFKGTDKIGKQLGSGGDHLVISFPYVEGSIDKVTYNIENQQFNLIVAPREGFLKLDPAQVRYSYSGAKVDLIITIDAPNLNSLGLLYSGNEEQFKGKDIINIDRHLTNANYGTVNVVERQSSSLSEIIYRIIETLGVALDKDISTSLYSGIMNATNNFTAYSVNAETFDVSAKLLKAGAIKKTIRPMSNVSPMRMPNFSQQAMPPVQQVQSTFESYDSNEDDFDDMNDDVDPFIPQQQAIPQPKRSTPVSQKQTGVYESDNAQPIQQVEAKEPITKENAPQDWLKPKIFRGGGGMV